MGVFIASLDFVSDLTEKLEKQQIDYVVITVQRGTGGTKLHVFYNIPNKEALDGVIKGIAEANEIVKELSPKLKNDNGTKRKRKGGK